MYRKMHDSPVVLNQRRDRIFNFASVRVPVFFQQSLLLIGRKLRREFREQARMMKRPIQLHQKSSNTGAMQRSIQNAGKLPSQRQRAWIPGAMTIQYFRCLSE